MTDPTEDLPTPAVPEAHRALSHALRDSAAIVAAAALPAEYRRDAFVIVAHRLGARPLRDIDIDTACEAIRDVIPPAGADLRGPVVGSARIDAERTTTKW